MADLVWFATLTIGLIVICIITAVIERKDP